MKATSIILWTLVFGIGWAVATPAVAEESALPADSPAPSQRIETPQKASVAVETDVAGYPGQAVIDVLLNKPLIALFVMITLGLAIGRIRVAGISLGSSGVLFVALVLGAMHYSIPSGISTLGLVLFVYCVGINAGPSFFRAFVRQGKTLAKLAVLLVVLGALTTVIFAKLADIPAGMAAGIFAGSLTSTPALAAATETLGDAGAAVSVGYGIAYPIGVIGVVLFVQLLPRLLGKPVEQMEAEAAAVADYRPHIVRVLVKVLNPSVIGKKLADIESLALAGCQIPRVMQGERLIPVPIDLTLEQDQHVLVVGEARSVPFAIDLLGRKSDKAFFMDTEHERMHVVVTALALIGKSLRQLQLLKNYGVTISRIARHDLEFVAEPDTVVQGGDVLSVVGPPDALQKFAAAAGHRAKTADETDITSLGLGIIAGVVLGMVPFTFPGLGKSFTLGMAGGPLLVALVLGHFGRIGRVVGHIPRPARILMMEIGLVFFLAGAGVDAGASFLSELREYGWVLLVMAASVTAAPMIVGLFIARVVLKMNLLQALGGICGGMTSTPGLGALTAKTDSDAPVVSYATAYPVALILMTVAAQIVISLLS